MSGIFKGDSIYKSGGGGGGGYKDGGQLVDGDFIKVENNTVSSYDNVSRDPVNFYFEVKDGEILNSVVELTTAVNATINVYVVKNGFYYLLGNVGVNTVNAGYDYKINITGDSYDVEQVNNISVDPEFVELNGTVYPIKKINGLLWITQDYKGNIPGVTSEVKNGTVYYTNGQIPTDLNVNGFRLPSNSEVTSLFTSLGGGSTAAVALRSTTTWRSRGAKPASCSSTRSTASPRRSTPRCCNSCSSKRSDGIACQTDGSSPARAIRPHTTSRCMISIS